MILIASYDALIHYLSKTVDIIKVKHVSGQ